MFFFPLFLTRSPLHTHTLKQKGKDKVRRANQKRGRGGNRKNWWSSKDVLAEQSSEFLLFLAFICLFFFLEQRKKGDLVFLLPHQARSLSPSHFSRFPPSRLTRSLPLALPLASSRGRNTLDAKKKRALQKRSPLSHSVSPLSVLKKKKKRPFFSFPLFLIRSRV